MRGPSIVYERLDEHPFDSFEKNVLRLARLFFLSFHYPQQQAWISAFEFADSEFGQNTGPQIAKSILDMVNAMRATRRSGFSYCDPHCKECSAFMTREERYLISTVHQFRRGQSITAQMNVMLLCEGGDGIQLINRIMYLVQFSNVPAAKV